MHDLTLTIQKQMLQKDEAMRKHMEEYTLLKNKISAMTKKDTGNLLVRDFTDEIYVKKVPKELFVEQYSSQLFTNVLVVLNDDKVQAFKDGV